MVCAFEVKFVGRSVVAGNDFDAVDASLATGNDIDAVVSSELWVKFSA